MTTTRAAPERYPLQRAEYLMIFLFWTAFGLPWSANALQVPGGRMVPLFPSAPVLLASASAWVWALLTPPLFVAASRLSVDRGHLAARILALIALGIVVGFAWAEWLDRGLHR